jgi:hypothetical protein
MDFGGFFLTMGPMWVLVEPRHRGLLLVHVQHLRNQVILPSSSLEMEMLSPTKFKTSMI